MSVEKLTRITFFAQAKIVDWDHLLAIDPGYEAATVYWTRALELKHRLKQL